MRPIEGLGSSMITAVYALPLAWLVSFAVFTAAVSFVAGHFPSYGNPDPKHVDDLHLLYMLTVELPSAGGRVAGPRRGASGLARVQASQAYH